MRHYLLVANQTLIASELREALRARLDEGPCAFYVLVPDTHVEDLAAGWAGLSALGGIPGVEALDHEAARREAGAGARARLEQTLEALRAAGAQAEGEVGDADPVRAVEAVLAERRFDEVLVSTLPDRLSRWLRLDLPNRLRHIVDVPVTVLTAG